MVAGLIDTMGAFGGTLVGAHPLNPKGFFENRHIRQEIVKPYLTSIGADPLGQDPLPDIFAVLRSLEVEDADHEVRLRYGFTSTMIDEGYEGGPVYYKGAKMCLVWPLWHAAFPKARWIIVRRPTEDIIASCIRTNFMRAHGTDKAAWRGWVKHHEDRFQEMMAPANGLDCREIKSNEVAAGNFSELSGIVRSLGLDWLEDQADRFLVPGAWHSLTER